MHHGHRNGKENRVEREGTLLGTFKYLKNYSYLGMLTFQY